MKTTIAITILFALMVIGGVLVTIATQRKYMDEISWMLAFISIFAAIAFPILTIFSFKSP